MDPFLKSLDTECRMTVGGRFHHDDIGLCFFKHFIVILIKGHIRHLGRKRGGFIAVVERFFKPQLFIDVTGGNAFEGRDLTGIPEHITPPVPQSDDTKSEFSHNFSPV